MTTDDERRPSARRKAPTESPAEPRQSRPQARRPSRSAAKKTAAKKSAAKKTAAKKTAAKKTAAKKTAAKKTAAKKTAAKKTAAKKTAAKKTAAKKTAAKKSAAKTSSAKRTDEDRPLNVVVTGVVGRLGQLLTRRLHRQHRVIGIDRRPFPGRPKDVVHHPIDLRRKKTRDVFRSEQIDAVVHLGVLHDPRASERERHKWNIVAFQKLLDYVAQYNIPKLVVLSSANVYGPQPDNPQFLTEDAPLLGAQANRGMRDLVEMDMLAQSFFWKHPETETVILRPCHILGGVRNAPSNYLRLQRPISIWGFDPMVQVIHERDVVRALSLALAPGTRGIFNLRGPGELPLSRLLHMAGRSPRPVPSFAAQSALERMWRLRLSSFPAAQIDFIRYVCMVDDQRARDVLGYAPRFDLPETISALFSER